MSRFRRVVHSVASGYVVLIAASLYSLATLPLGLHFLSERRLGLWTLMASISGCLSQIDLGMSISLARLLIDHKDEREGQNYGSLIQTGWLVLLVQGSIIGLVGFILAPVLASLLNIDADLRAEFISLMRWMIASLALSFYAKIFSHLLHVHQRMDLVNYSQIINLVLGLGLIWWFFRADYGVLSLAWATLITTVLGNAFLALCCLRLHLLPRPGYWGRPSWSQFKSIFSFGKDIFLVSVGTQLIMASQPMIIARQLGEAYATLWYAGTRVFSLVNQVIWRIADMSMPAFAEMMVRRENILLRERYKSIVALTASFSAFAAISFGLCNSVFVSVWTSFSKKEPLFWPQHNDWLLGPWMIILAMLHCHGNFVLSTKRVGFMRYVFFVEGLVFVAAGLAIARWGGFPGIIVCSILCGLALSGPYNIARVSGYFGLSFRSVALETFAPISRVLLFFGPIAFLTWFLCRNISDPIVRLGVHVLVCAFAGFPLFLRHGLPPGIQKELLQRAPRYFNPILRRVFASSP